MIKLDGMDYYMVNLEMYRQGLIMHLAIEAGAKFGERKDQVDFIRIEELVSDIPMIRTPKNLLILLDKEFYRIISTYNHSRGEGDCRA